MLRIGTLLVQAGLATDEAVERALAVQRFAGGRLGTLLLEKGSIGESELGTTLAVQHGCEYVPWSSLSDLTPSTIAALPAKFAIRHSAVPFERGEGFLRIVLRDPSDLRILDELFFITGRKIFAAVCPEVRIYQALEKYYGERRTPRFAILAEKLSRPTAPSVIRKPLPPPPDFFPSAPARDAAPAPREIWEEGGEIEGAEAPIIQSWRVPDAPPVGWAGPHSKPSKELAESGPESIPWEDVAPPSVWLDEQMEAAQKTVPPALPFSPPLPTAERAPSPAAADTREARPPGGPPRRERLPEAGDFPEVLAAPDRDATAQAVLEALRRRFSRAAIFASRPDGVFGWAGSGPGVQLSELRGIEIPWDEPSLFLNVRLSRAFYLGPLPPLPRHRALALALGGKPEECVVQPVFLRDRPVAFLYAEPGREHGITPMDLAYLRALAAAASTALARSIRMKKGQVI